MADPKRIAQCASLCYLVRAYCADAMTIQNEEFLNPSVIMDAMEIAHDLLTWGDNLD